MNVLLDWQAKKEVAELLSLLGWDVLRAQDTGLDGSSDVEHGDVAIAGESQCKIGGNISIDDPLQADTDGMAIVGTTADHIFARALEGGVDGDLIRCIISSEGIF